MDKRVGLGRRLPALLIDVVAIWVIIAGTQQVGMLASSAKQVGPSVQSGKWWIGIWFMLLVAPPLAGVMYSACEAIFAATPGRMLLRQRIADANGRPATRRQLLFRWAIKFAALILMAAWIAYFSIHVALTNGRGMNIVLRGNYIVMPLIGVIALVTSVGGLLSWRKPRRQALHDRLTNTAVFRKVDLTSASFEPVFAAREVRPVEAPVS